MLVETQAWRGFGQHRGERRLAGLERLPTQVVAVQLDQVEGVQKDPVVIAAVADALEARHTVVIAAHRLAVDDAGARAQPGQRRDDQREPVAESLPGRL